VVFDPANPGVEAGPLCGAQASALATAIASPTSTGILDRWPPTDLLPDAGRDHGEGASAFCPGVFAADRYNDYLYFHGLGGARWPRPLADVTPHRLELGFGPARNPASCRRAGPSAMRGSRYSFGYRPAHTCRFTGPQLTGWGEQAASASR